MSREDIITILKGKNPAWRVWNDKSMVPHLRGYHITMSSESDGSRSDENE